MTKEQLSSEERKVPTAFVLLSTQTGAETDVLEDLEKTKNVNEAFAVFGAYDVVAKIKTETMHELKETVLQCIRKRASVKSTLTMLVVE